MNLDWLERWNQFSPNATAFEEADSDHHYKYGELFFLSCVLGKKLAESFRITRGDRVAVLSTNEIEYVAIFFALQRLGAILVPINFRLTSPEIAHVINDSDPKLIIHQQQFPLPSLAQSAATWSLDGASSVKEFIATELAQSRSRFTVHRSLSAVTGNSLPSPATVSVTVTGNWILPFAGLENDPCMILYTSGTTGSPKGALITNKMLHWNSLNTGLRLNLQQSDVFVSFLPFFHTSGWNVLLTPFVHRGARTVLMRKFDADKVLELSERHGATILFGVPTILEMMARSKKFAQSNLSKCRYAIVGGEPMSIELIRTWQKKGVAIRQGFGLTEFGPSVFSLNEEDAVRKIGSIGFPNFYVEARIVDDQGRDVAVDQIGELILKGDVCTPGYWRNDEATQASIKDGWFYTGDLVRKDSEGYYFVAGRKKEMFISGGENVYPVEIERLLSTHPSIREVAVIGVPDDKWGEVGKAIISIKAGDVLTADDVLSFCKQGLAKYKIPKHVQFMNELPKGDSGKILKRALT